MRPAKSRSSHRHGLASFFAGVALQVSGSSHQLHDVTGELFLLVLSIFSAKDQAILVDSSLQNPATRAIFFTIFSV